MNTNNLMIRLVIIKLETMESSGLMNMESLTREQILYVQNKYNHLKESLQRDVNNIANGKIQVQSFTKDNYVVTIKHNFIQTLKSLVRDVNPSGKEYNMEINIYSEDDMLIQINIRIYTFEDTSASLDDIYVDVDRRNYDECVRRKILNYDGLENWIHFERQTLNFVYTLFTDNIAPIISYKLHNSLENVMFIYNKVARELYEEIQ